MKKTNEIFVATIACVGSRNYFDQDVGNNLAAIKKGVLDKLIDFYSICFPNINKLRVSNSVYLIANYNETEFQDRINKIVAFFSGKEKIIISYLKIEPKIRNDQIEEIDHDIT